MEAKSNILKKKDLFCLLHPAALHGFQPLKEETNTRLILKGRLGNTKETLIIKIFKRPHFFDQVKYLFRPPRSRKEWQIGKKLSYLGIPTPSLVAYIALRRWGVLTKDIIAFREISDAEPLIKWIEINFIKKPLPFFERQEVVGTLGRFVRRIHDQGIFSKDFHQGNILIKTEPMTPPLFYLIDLHAIRIKKETTRRDRIKMLAQFNDFRIPIADRLRFLKAYLQEEGQEKVSKKTLAKEIGLASFRHWQRLWQKRKKRSLRPGKGLETFAVDAWKGMIRKGYYFEDVFPLLDKLGANMKGADSVVKEVFLQEKAKGLVIRYYNQTSFFSTLRSFFQISPAKKTWVTMHNVIIRGISTLAPVAFGERKRWGILRDCFFAFEKISDATSSAIFLKELSGVPLIVQNTCFQQGFIFPLAQLIRRMHQTGICYRTLNLNDIGVTFDHKKVSLHVLDVDRMTIKKYVGINEVAKDLSAINLLFLHVLDKKDQNFFFTIYAWGNTFFKDNEKKIRDKMQKLSTKRDK
jgi:tRNA A-37 threonylcarbamoyl transferase component Bud32